MPSDYVGNVMKLCEEKRGIQKNMGYLAQNRVVITYELPFAEIVFDFFDRLKSATRGYASMDYEVIDYRASNLVRLDILLNGEAVDALAVIVHKDKSYAYGVRLPSSSSAPSRARCSKWRFRPPSARRSSPAKPCPPSARTSPPKCYGGDITRKRKLSKSKKKAKSA